MAITETPKLSDSSEQAVVSQAADTDALQYSWLTNVLLFLIRLYQLTLSPLIGGQCRFYPSCSHYAQDALRVHGSWYGSGLVLRRLSRCHPFSDGGVDEVPLATRVRKASPGCACPEENSRLVNRNR